MKKTLAIPARLLKSELSEAEQAELAQFGDKDLSAEDIAQIEVDEAHSVERKKEAQREDIRRQLREIDQRSIRALRAGETDRLVELEGEAEELRKELSII